MAAANASQSGSERAAVPHARWQLLEQVYRAYKLQQVSAAAADTAVYTSRAAITPAHKTGTTPTPVSAEPMSSAEQGNVSALTSLTSLTSITSSSSSSSAAGVTATKNKPVLTGGEWKRPQLVSRCFSYEACCLLELYRPLLAPTDLLLCDVRVGLEQIPLLIASARHGLLLLSLYPDSPQQLSSDLPRLLQQARRLSRLKQDLLSSFSKELKLSLDQALALQDCSLVLICLASCQVADIKQQVLPQLRTLPRPQEAAQLRALFTDQAPEIRLRYLKQGAYVQVQASLQQRYQDLAVPQNNGTTQGTLPLWLLLPPKAAEQNLPDGAFTGTLKTRHEGAANAAPAASAAPAALASPAGTTEPDLFTSLRWPQVAAPQRFLLPEQLRYLRQLLLKCACTYQPLATTQVVSLRYSTPDLPTVKEEGAGAVIAKPAPAMEEISLPVPVMQHLQDLDGFQLSVILSTLPVLLLSGVFGSGRTLVLVARALYVYMQWCLFSQQAESQASKQEQLQNHTAESPTQGPKVLILYAHAPQGHALMRCLQQQAQALAVPLSDFALCEASSYLQQLQEDPASLPRCPLLFVDEVQEFSLAELQALYEHHQPHCCLWVGDFCQERWRNTRLTGNRAEPQGQALSRLDDYALLGQQLRAQWQQRNLYGERLLVLPQLRAEHMLLTSSEQQLLHGVFLANPKADLVRLLPLTYRGAPLLTSLVLKYQLQSFSPEQIGFNLRELCDNLTELESFSDDGAAEGEVVHSYTRQAMERMPQQASRVPTDGSFSALRSWVQQWTQRVQQRLVTGQEQAASYGGAWGDMPNPVVQEPVVDPCGNVSWRHLPEGQSIEHLCATLCQEAQQFSAGLEPLFALPLLSAQSGSSAQSAQPVRPAQVAQAAQPVHAGALAEFALLCNEPRLLPVIDFVLRHTGRGTFTHSVMTSEEDALLQVLFTELGAGSRGKPSPVQSLLQALIPLLQSQLRQELRMGQQVQTMASHLQRYWCSSEQGQHYYQLWQQGVRLSMGQNLGPMQTEFLQQMQLLLQKLEQAQAPLHSPTQERLDFKVFGKWEDESLPDPQDLPPAYKAMLWALAVPEVQEQTVFRQSLAHWRLRLIAPTVKARLTKLLAAALFSSYIPVMGQMLDLMVGAYGPQGGKLLKQVCLSLSSYLRPRLQEIKTVPTWAQDHFKLSHKCLHLSTVEAFQGLESERLLIMLLPPAPFEIERVRLVQGNDETEPHPQLSLQPERITPALVYSAITRARSQLRLVHQLPILAQHLEPLLQQVHEDMMALREEAQASADPVAAEAAEELEADAGKRMVVVGMGKVF